jgi:signal peptidase I
MTQSSLLTTDLPQPSSLGPHYFVPDLVKDILSQGAECRFQAKGHSMSPFIKDGDVVTISPVLRSSPGIGDVVAFIYEETGKLLIHRVVGKNGESYLTRGDNTLQGDGLIYIANILGYVRKVERKGKRVSLGLGPERFLIAFFTRKGLLLSFVLPVWRVFPSIIRKSVKLFL